MKIPLVFGNAPVDVVPTAMVSQVSEHRTVSAVVGWAAEDPSSRTLVASFAQDEFTHDFVASISGRTYLAYDVT